MRQKFLPFGKSPVDTLVWEFMRRKNIDPNDITGYTITRNLENIGTITFDMIFDGTPLPDGE
jgi:hypothetical protein